MDNPWTLMWGVLFGSIGLGFFVYGRKKKAIIPFVSGLGLMTVPYFIANIYIMILSCVVLMAVPYFIRL